MLVRCLDILLMIIVVTIYFSKQNVKLVFVVQNRELPCPVSSGGRC